MLFLIAFVGAAIIALVLWKAMNPSRRDAPQAPRTQAAGPAARPRVSGPDDDPEFLRKMDSEQSRRARELLAQMERELRRDDEQQP